MSGDLQSGSVPQWRMRDQASIRKQLGLVEIPPLIYQDGRGCRFLIEEHFCTNPDCPCTDVMLAVVPELVQAKLVIMDRLAEQNFNTMTFDSPPIINIQYDRDTRQAGSIEIFANQLSGCASVRTKQEAERIARDLLTRLDDERIVSRWRRMAQQAKESGRLDEHQTDEEEEDSAPAEPRVASKPGRNDPCPCGSGKKSKHCCGRGS